MTGFVGGDNAVLVIDDNGTAEEGQPPGWRYAQVRNMPLPWARQPIARRWCQQRVGERRSAGDGRYASVSTGELGE